MGIEMVIEKGKKLTDEAVRNVGIQYDSLRFRVNLLLTASIFPFILVPFVDLYLPVTILNGLLLFVLAILDYKTVEKQIAKAYIHHKKDIDNLYHRYYQDAI